MTAQPSGADELHDARRPLIFIHSSIDDLTDLTPNAMRVYMHLARRAGKANAAFPSYQSIADHCFSSVSKNAATRKSFARAAIQQLIDAGLIVKTNRNEDGLNKSNIYKLVDPAVNEESSVPNKHTMPIGTPMPNKHTGVLNKHGGVLNKHQRLSSEGNPIEENPPKGVSARVGAEPQRALPPPLAPAIAIYEEICGRKPNREQHDLILTTVTDLDLWRTRLREWMARDYKPGNVVDQLDVYVNGFRAHGSQNGANHANGKRSRPHQSADSPDEGHIWPDGTWHSIPYDPSRHAGRLRPVAT